MRSWSSACDFLAESLSLACAPKPYSTKSASSWRKCSCKQWSTASNAAGDRSAAKRRRAAAHSWCSASMEGTFTDSMANSRSTTSMSTQPPRPSQPPAPSQPPCAHGKPHLPSTHPAPIPHLPSPQEPGAHLPGPQPPSPHLPGPHPPRPHFPSAHPPPTPQFPSLQLPEPQLPTAGSWVNGLTDVAGTTMALPCNGPDMKPKWTEGPSSLMQMPRDPLNSGRSLGASSKVTNSPGQTFGKGFLAHTASSKASTWAKAKSLTCMKGDVAADTTRCSASRTMKPWQPSCP
mmetsp:Transcript_127819/g.368031  ORF Transcript_127819/g.368031 Transcript_127819/m.368031 type:complete len:289 (+) Transcript_127819:614-1480(+)